ncbi:thioesterase family protein [Ruegeria lacuscaerulensis]|uniref:thioesterase family protein n=1 Tax=Ruegeria lacuscaerulensis TaxID=55218 RepID=UPI00147E784B|nr:thioesterase family protein [Ruegeria lacuscaerulensis]
MIFSFEATVKPEWIDYNGHMQDAYYGLVFSYAVDAMQDEVGFDAEYRARTGCTIYLLEDHKYYLREVKEADHLRIETRILNCDEKRFHLHMEMLNGDDLAAVGEFMELHVRQKPSPQAAPIPAEILQRLQAATLSGDEAAKFKHRSRSVAIERDAHST